MKIAIDVTALLPERTGVDTYMQQLVQAVARIDGESRYTLFVNAPDRFLFNKSLGPNFTVVPASLRPRVVRLAFQQLALPAAASFLDVDVVHSPAFIMPAVRGRGRHLLTVHDMTSFSLPQYDTRLHRSRAFLRAVSESIRRADLIVVPSQHVKDELCRIVPGADPDRVRVVAHGVGAEFQPAARHASEVLARLGIRKPYLLHVGTIQPRKNLETLLDSYSDLIRQGGVDVRLVLAGKPGWSYAGITSRLTLPELRDRVRLTGWVEPVDLPSLYAEAEAFVYPSLEEGFGLPPLEAMASGVPVVASSCPSMVENLHGAAELVPPGDRRALTEALRRVLSDAGRRSELRQRGSERAASFRWETAARATHALYAELAEKRPSLTRASARPRRPRGVLVRGDDGSRPIPTRTTSESGALSKVP